MLLQGTAATRNQHENQQYRTEPSSNNQVAEAPTEKIEDQPNDHGRYEDGVEVGEDELSREKSGKIIALQLQPETMTSSRKNLDTVDRQIQLNG